MVEQKAEAKVGRSESGWCVTKFGLSSGYIACENYMIGDKTRKGGKSWILILECRTIGFGLILE